MDLTTALNEGLANLAAELASGSPRWLQRTKALPVWMESGRVIRGLAALFLWKAERPTAFSGAWRPLLPSEGPQKPTENPSESSTSLVQALPPSGVLVVPLPGRRAWRPAAVVAAPRLTANPNPVPEWKPEHEVEVFIAELGIAQCPPLYAYLPVVEALSHIFLAALRRVPPPIWVPLPGLDASALSVAAPIAALIADAAFARAMGRFFRGPLAHLAGSTADLFPSEARQFSQSALDRPLRKGGRFLRHGKGVGRLALQQRGHIRLDRIMERGGVLAGLGRVHAALAALKQPITGDPVLDARRLGRQLAGQMQALEPKPPAELGPQAEKFWTLLRSRVAYRGWYHHLDTLIFADLCADRKRWRRRELTIQAYKAAGSNRGTIPLSSIGLMHLLVAHGPARNMEPCSSSNLLTGAGGPLTADYRRHPLRKRDGSLRWLDVPSPALASLQEKLVAALRPRAPASGFATAFEPGRSPAQHARMHQGAVAAVVMDIADFFGSIRPRHLRWAFCPPPERRHRAIYLEGTPEEREALLLHFFAGEGHHRWLPQGAPSSPWIANLAAQPMDRRIWSWAREQPGVRYSRYADDLVLSLEGPASEAVMARFLTEAPVVLQAAVEAQGWQVHPTKTRSWRQLDRAPLTLCGVEVPRDGGPCGLPRPVARRARAALFHLRQGELQVDRGILAWARGASGAVGWMAWSSRFLDAFCCAAAGSLLGEAVMAGWADSVDYGESGE
jgi:hypothetical protein